MTATHRTSYSVYVKDGMQSLTEPQTVTVENFIRAESDPHFQHTVARGDLGTFQRRYASFLMASSVAKPMY